MIYNLNELNDKINAFVNYVVKRACESTTSGQYYVSVDEACKVAGMGYDDFLQYKEIIHQELYKREELLEIDFLEDELEFDVNCALDYCPGYQWCDGDESIFKCSFEEWLDMPAKPVSQPLSLTRMAEIAEAAVEELKSVSFDSQYYNDTFVSNLGFTPDEAAAFGLNDALDFAPIFYVGDGLYTSKEFSTFAAALKAFEVLTHQNMADVTLGIMLPDKSSYALMYSNNGIIEKLDFSLDNISDKELAYEIAEKCENIYKQAIPENDLILGKWRVHIVPPGGVFLSHTNNSDKSLIEFWDMSADKDNFPNGQFASRFLFENLFDERSFGGQAHLSEYGLCLASDRASGWKVTGTDMNKVFNWLRRRELLPKERYFEYHGDVDLPYDQMNRLPFGEVNSKTPARGEFVIYHLLEELPFVRDINVECFGTYNNGHGYSFSFTSQADKKTVEKGLNEALSELKFEACGELKVVKCKDSLDNIIRSCEMAGKDSKVVDINEFRRNKERDV